MHCTTYPIFCWDAFVSFALFQIFLLLLTVLPWTRWGPLCSYTGVSAEQWMAMLRACENYLGSSGNHQRSGPTSRNRNSVSECLGRDLRTEVFLQTPMWYYWVICLGVHPLIKFMPLFPLNPPSFFKKNPVQMTPLLFSLLWPPSSTPPLTPIMHSRTQNHSAPFLCAHCLLVHVTKWCRIADVY